MSPLVHDAVAATAIALKRQWAFLGSGDKAGDLKQKEKTPCFLKSAERVRISSEKYICILKPGL